MKKKISLSAVILLSVSIGLMFPLSVTYAASLPWFMKPSFPDYAPSGMPDFDQRQGGTYLWQFMGAWSHCGPVAVANSLWWLDSEFEVSTTPPPAIMDNYPLVRTYLGGIDDHDAANVPFFVEHLAYLMDTNGLRTLIAHLGTNVNDMQAGITHYLSWSGVNPLGDVNGDGTVTAADQAIVIAAMGKSPGMLGWDMRADVFPVTTLPPGGKADNLIDPQDLNLVLMHMGLTGKFYEHTVMAPDWQTIVNEVLQCQDVVLLIAPWVWTGSTWYRYTEDAHFVTIAGLNATSMEIVFSNPITDNAEAGGPGDVPVPHAHPPLEPPYITHNDAKLVSHDMYPVIISPCPGGPLALPTYSGSITPPPAGSIWQIEAAVITSPFGIRDIAVTSMTVCYGQTNLAQNRTHNINITVANQGTIDDVFTLTLYWNRTNILETTRMLLAAGQTQVVTVHWYTSQKRYNGYSLSAVVSPVCGETDDSDNVLIGPTVKIVWPGDVTGDKKVDILDVAAITGAYAAVYPNPSYRPNSDIDDSGSITILDVVLCTGQYAVIIPP